MLQLQQERWKKLLSETQLQTEMSLTWMELNYVTPLQPEPPWSFDLVEPFPPCADRCLNPWFWQFCEEAGKMLLSVYWIVKKPEICSWVFIELDRRASQSSWGWTWLWLCSGWSGWDSHIATWHRTPPWELLLPKKSKIKAYLYKSE